jgi:uncharacterized protein YjlB
MNAKKQISSVEYFYLKDDKIFPNSTLPVLLYKKVLVLPPVFGAAYVKKLFKRNGWANSWKYGIYEYNHYHSITHETMAVCGGKTRLLLGGNKGETVSIEKGDVVIIPAGVAHKNLGNENDVQCVGAYPGGMDYDINYGNVGERPHTDQNIRKVPKPSKDPVFGAGGGLLKYW